MAEETPLLAAPNAAAASPSWSGFAGDLWLEAPASWWPAHGDGTLFPSRDFRTGVGYARVCVAAMAADAVPFPVTPFDRPSPLLSRLGHTTFLLQGEWDDPQRPRAVLLTDPFEGGTLVFPILHCPPTLRLPPAAALAAPFAEVMAAFPEGGHIRLTPSRCEAPSPESQSSASSSSPDISQVQQLVEQWLQTASDELLTHSSIASSSQVHTAVLCGASGSGKRRCLQDARTGSGSRSATHTIFRSSSGGAGAEEAKTNVIWEVECRAMDCSLLMGLDIAEAVSAVRQLLKPIPLSYHSRSAATAANTTSSRSEHLTMPLVWVELYHLDLLLSTSSAVPAAIQFEMLHQLDSISNSSSGSGSLCGPVWVWGTAPQMPVSISSLWCRLASHTIHFAAPPKPAASPASTVDEGDAYHPYAALFGVDSTLDTLERLVVWPLLHAAALRHAHIPCVKGALLCGETGCGKTAVLAAVAERLRRQPGIHVEVRDCLTLIEKEVGRTEEKIAELFQGARSHAICVLVLDNLDAIAVPRGREAQSGGGQFADRMLSTLLVEMDGLGHRNPDGGEPNSSQTLSPPLLMVLASAPSLKVLDPAAYRSGRLDICLLLSAPTPQECVEEYVRRLLPVVLEDGGEDSSEKSTDVKEALRSAATQRVQYLTAQHRATAAQIIGDVRDVTIEWGRCASGLAEDPVACITKVFASLC